MKGKLQAQHIFLFIAALAGAVWFFYAYPSQDVRSSLELNLSKQEVENIATHQLHFLGYATDELTISQILFLQDKYLLDSLQVELGRQNVSPFLSSDSAQNIKPFYWQVIFAKLRKTGSQTSNNKSSYGSRKDYAARLWLDEKGRFIALDNAARLFPENKIGSDSTVNTALESANYYLQNSGWNFNSFEVDTVINRTISSNKVVRVKYKLKKREAGQRIAIEVLITPTGHLLNFEVDYNSSNRGPLEENLVWIIITNVLIILFGIVLLIIFYMRMRARVIDTRPAVIAAVLVGFIVAIYGVLWVIGPTGLFTPSYTGPNKAFVILLFGLLAAGACLATFILFAVGDSLTRQYWPQKLQKYDYLQQGMIFNRPIGSAVLKSVAVAFILAGLWTLILSFFPKIYFYSTHVFISQAASLAILRLATHSIWANFFTLISIFLVAAVGLYNKQKRTWLAAIAIIIAIGFIGFPFFPMGPPWLRFLPNAILGIFLFIIFAKWDFFTLLLSNILFCMLLGSTGGWIIGNSPDLSMFAGVVFIFVVLILFGSVAVYFGKNEQELVDYEPEYVQEHADEDRIKQELKIAREVQQSFLPTRTPQKARLDIAATCVPAYETGGDYYDFIELDKDRVGVAIGDVSGKGIQAAFYMTFVKGLLHSLSREMISPAEILKKANYFFYDNASKSTFISLIYGVIDMKERTFTFARAGHNPIIHLNTATGDVAELRPNGLGLGLTKDKVFDNKINEIKLSITEDDLLLLYTDGITEALNEKHEFYGTTRLINEIKKHQNESAPTLISTINKEVNSFIGTAKQHDDMTAMAIRLIDKRKTDEDKKNNKQG